MTDIDPVYCDITELVGNPIRTGIQRVVREVLKNWPGPRPLRLCRFDQQQLDLVELPPEAIYHLLEPDQVTRSRPVEEIRDSLARAIAGSAAALVPTGVTILIPEVFFDEARCRHHLWRLESEPARTHILFFDFIPWLDPELIGVERTSGLMWYLRLAQKARRPAFISNATARNWASRIVRDAARAYTVLPLGADGLQLGRQSFSPEKRDFVALGSIDGRKNQHSIMQAFSALWNEGLDVGLTLVGRVFEGEASLRAELAELAAEPRFRHVNGATDDEVAAILSGARATIYASAVEGYGLPPVESLAAGIPCLVGRHVPSVENLSGIVPLADTSPEEIASKVRLMADNVEAEKVWAEAAKLTLPTWKGFGRAVAEWVGSD